MQNRLFRKSLVIGIIILFLGASVTPSISGNIKNVSNIEKRSYFRNNVLRSDLIEKINYFRNKDLKSSRIKDFLPISNRQLSDWTLTELVSSESTGESMYCSLAIDANGTIHVAWEDATDYGGSGIDTDIFYKTKPYEGNWTTTEVVSSESSIESTFVSLAVESNGTVHVTWDEYDDYSNEVYYKMKPSGGSWTAAEIISPEGCVYSGYSSLSVGSDGTLHVAMNGVSDPEDWDIYYKKKPSGGSWTGAEHVTYDSTGWAGLPTLDVESDGSVHIAWYEWDGGDIIDIYYKMKPSGGSWTAAEAVTQTYTESFDPSLVVDQDSNVHVVWSELTPEMFLDVCYKVKPSGGGWSSTVILSSYSMSLGPSSIAAGSDGTVHVVFDELDPESFYLHIFYRNKPSGGSWSTKELVTYDFEGDSYIASVEVMPTLCGSVHVVWEGYAYYSEFDDDEDIYYKNNGYENLPPETPSDPSPPDGAIYVDPDADLSWTGGDPNPGDTVTYDVYFGTSSPPPKIVSNQTDTTYDLGTMGYNTQHFWKVVAWDNFNEFAEGPIWEFTTEGPNNPPNTPSNPSPPDDATDVDINADLSWTGGDPDPGDTVTYDVYFGTTSPPPLVSSGQSGTTYDPGPLNFEEMYYWQIVAWDNHGVSSSGPIWSFTTRVNNPPNTPSNPSPPDDATDVDVDADLSWDCSDPDGDDLTYDVYFGKSSDPPLVAVGISETFYDPGTLDYDETYYWKIVAEDEYGATATGPIWSFTTGSEPNHPPNTPSDPDPSNGTIDCDINIDLSWTGGDPDEDDTVVYDVYLEANNPNPTTKVSDDQTETTFDPGTLEYSTIYYWKIHAKDNHNRVTRGPVWHFTTEEAPNEPPDSPTIDGQISGKVGTEYEYTFNAVDPNSDDVKYHIDWDDGDSDTTAFSPSGTDVIVKHTWSDEGTYTIRATAEDTYGLVGSEATLTVTMPRNKISASLFLRFLERLEGLFEQFPNLFPILQTLLQRLVVQ